MKHIHRRDMLRGAGVSALAGIVPATASALPIEPKGGELAALIRLLLAANRLLQRHGAHSDEHSDAVAAATYEKAMWLATGVPARNAEDALAGLDWGRASDSLPSPVVWQVYTVMESDPQKIIE